MAFKSLAEVQDEFEAIGHLSDDPKLERNQLLLRLARELEPMPEALKTDETRVTGCASDVWVYALPNSTSNRLHFLADGNSDLTKGIIALILLAVQDRSATQVLATDIPECLRPFNVQNQLSSLRTSGLANMIEKIRETAARLAS